MAARRSSVGKGGIRVVRKLRSKPTTPLKPLRVLIVEDSENDTLLLPAKFL